MARDARPRPRRRHHRCALERGAGAQPLPPLGRVHAGRQLGRADDLAQECPRCRRMSDPINIRALMPGMQITLTDGAVAEIVSNPADGVWVFARYLVSPSDPALVGQEVMFFDQVVVADALTKMRRHIIPSQKCGYYDL